jgi:hypothetical protein
MRRAQVLVHANQPVFQAMQLELSDSVRYNSAQAKKSARIEMENWILRLTERLKA